MKKNKLYLLLAVLLAAGYAYLFATLVSDGHSGHGINTCVIKNTTSYPCPSCGSTRSVISIINGKFSDALLLNPLGYIITLVMLVLPLWLLFDIILSKATLHKSYTVFETTLRKKQVAIPLIILIIANWIWNITKGL
jgi:hypothetical protein